MDSCFCLSLLSFVLLVEKSPAKLTCLLMDSFFTGWSEKNGSLFSFFTTINKLYSTKPPLKVIRGKKKESMIK